MQLNTKMQMQSIMEDEKKELQRAVESLVEEDEDDYNLEATDQAIKALFALTDLNNSNNDNKQVDEMKKMLQDWSTGELVEGTRPHGFFKWPISGSLMEDPVVIASDMISNVSKIDEMDAQGGIHMLFSLLTKKNISEQHKEVCVAILYTICFSDEMKVKKIRVPNAHEILSRIARTGTSRAKRKENGILKRLHSDEAATSA